MPRISEELAVGLSDRIRKLRKSRKLSQDTLAARAALARTNLASVEQGRRANLRLSTITRLAAELGVDVVDFFSDRSPENQVPAEPAPEARLITNVKRLRTDQGLSQEKLSEKAGRFRTYVNRLENGGVNPMLADIDDLARALGSSVEELLSVPLPPSSAQT